MFEQTFKAIDDTLWKDAGCSNELDYVEQTSWILFLKYLDDLEKDRKDAAELSGKSYSPIITGEYRWDKWGASLEVRPRYLGKPDSQMGTPSNAGSSWSIPVVMGITYHF